MINHSRRRIGTFITIFTFMLIILTVPVNANFKSVSIVWGFSFTDLNGNTYDASDFSEDRVVVIYGRSGCSNTRAMLNTAEKERASGISLKTVVLGVDSYDSGLYSLSKQYPNALFVKASTVNNMSMWTTLGRCGYTSKNLTLPATFILDKYRHIVYYSTGYDTSSLSYTLKYGSYSNKISLSNFNSQCYPSEYVYTGKSIIPRSIQVNAPSGYLLKEGRDYSVSISNNKKIGTAKVTITGIGGFSGTRSISFKIYSNGLKKGKSFDYYKYKYKVTKGGKSGKIEVCCTKLLDLSWSFFCPDSNISYKANVCKVTSIAANICKGRKNLNSVSLGNTIKTIGSRAFKNCTNIRTVSLWDSVKTIGSEAFYNCSSLKEIRIYSKKLNSKTVGKKAFSKVDANAVVYVPASCINKYKKFLYSKGLPKTAKIVVLPNVTYED